MSDRHTVQDVALYRGVAPYARYQVHLLSERGEAAARSYCGLHERYDFWRLVDSERVTCGACLRYAADVEEPPV